MCARTTSQHTTCPQHVKELVVLIASHPENPKSAIFVAKDVFSTKPTLLASSESSVVVGLTLAERTVSIVSLYRTPSNTLQQSQSDLDGTEASMLRDTHGYLWRLEFSPLFMGHQKRPIWGLFARFLTEYATCSTEHSWTANVL